MKRLWALSQPILVFLFLFAVFAVSLAKDELVPEIVERIGVGILLSVVALGCLQALVQAFLSRKKGVLNWFRSAIGKKALKKKSLTKRILA